MLLDAVRRTEKEHQLLHGCQGLILAVSGGPDSMAMLHRYAHEKRTFPLHVVHVHHGLRPESDGEERMVAEYCKTLGIPCHVRHVNVKDEMGKGETVESAARRLRYGFFRAVGTETGCTHLATAHTRDDQCETVLLHLLHGAGPKGLCGILPKRQEENLTLIRPMIDCGKEEILAYCAERDVPYGVDASNDDLTYTRNRIRHVILPEMEKINPQIRSTLCNTASVLQKQQQALELRAESFLAACPGELPVCRLKAFPEGEQAEILRMLFDRQGKQLSFEQTNQALALLKKETGTVEFDRKYRLHLGQNTLTLTENADPLPEIRITGETTVLPDGRILRLRKAVSDPSNRISLIPVRLPLCLRPRKEGDEILTPGGTKTLKKRMIELKIPQSKRDRLWVLSDGDTVLWCEAVGANLKTTPKPTEEGYFISLSEK